MKINAEATQSDIARLIGVDVSTVNKILNRKHDRKSGPKFRKSTIHSVYKAARTLGYDVSRAQKGRLEQQHAEMRLALKKLVWGIEKDPAVLGSLQASLGADEIRKTLTFYR
jgi:DNA-binding LacI/PurR family transcriptional regulator